MPFIFLPERKLSSLYFLNYDHDDKPRREPRPTRQPAFLLRKGLTGSRVLTFRMAWRFFLATFDSLGV